MPTSTAAGSRDKEADAYRYQRHQPENNLLYRIVERHYPKFTAYLAEQGAVLPRPECWPSSTVPSPRT